jgi:hypothetical protein
MTTPHASAQSELYYMPKDAQSRWSSFENLKGEKGKGGTENQRAKGHAFNRLRAGEAITLMEAKGAGTIDRMWFTLRERNPKTLRALRLDMYWDGAKTPAVSVPFGDFFCAILGRTATFENEFYSNPEGRSFNCHIPMPFRNGAKITITNESNKDIERLFYDINYTLLPSQPDGAMYFHASWRRERYTKLEVDFEILPILKGRGRFLGCHIGLMEHPDNVGWWGEGEVKVFLDGDTVDPTLVGTGTEDYIGTGWGQGAFAHRFQGCLVADGPNKQWGFYRYHVPDPVYFQKDIRVTIQQMGGGSKAQIVGLLDKGVEIKPISMDSEAGFTKLLELKEPFDIRSETVPAASWINIYRRDDVSAVAFFYLDKPENGLAPLSGAASRTEAMSDEAYQKKP